MRAVHLDCSRQQRERRSTHVYDALIHDQNVHRLKRKRNANFLTSQPRSNQKTQCRHTVRLSAKPFKLKIVRSGNLVYVLENVYTNFIFFCVFTRNSYPKRVLARVEASVCLSVCSSVSLFDNIVQPDENGASQNHKSFTTGCHKDQILRKISYNQISGLLRSRGVKKRIP